jgi:hypothetical protein
MMTLQINTRDKVTAGDNSALPSSPIRSEGQTFGFASGNSDDSASNYCRHFVSNKCNKDQVKTNGE